MAKQYKITLIKSLIGRNPQHLKVAEALGLGKTHRSVLKPINKSIEGMINKINYLLKVEEV